MKVSIVLCSFNQAKFIEETLLSVFNQSNIAKCELEIIVIDGNSSDGTQDILAKYASRFDYYVSEPDNGQTDALIKGFQKATGDIFGWLCSDDILEPNTIREVIDTFSRRPRVQWLYGDSHWIDIDGKFFWPRREIPFCRFIWLHDYNYIPQPSCFWRRELYLRVGGLNPAFRLAMDGDLWARFLAVSRPKHVRRMWSRMRFYAAQKNQCLREVSDREDRIIRERMNVSFQSPLQIKARYCLAKAMRVGWKLGYACYWPPRAPWSPRPH